MARGSFSLGRAFGDAWRALTQNPRVVVLGLLVHVGIGMAIVLVPRGWLLAQLVVGGPLFGGLCVFALNLVRQTDPSVGNLFAGFAKFGRNLGLSWLLALIWLAVLLPIVAAAVLMSFVVASVAGEDAGIVVGTVAMALGALVWYFVVVRWLFAYFVIADDWEEGSAITALKKSAEITRGNRIRLSLAFIVLSLFGVVAFSVSSVGMLVTGPIVNCAVASMYLQLKESATRPGAPSAPVEAVE